MWYVRWSKEKCIGKLSLRCKSIVYRHIGEGKGSAMKLIHVMLVAFSIVGCNTAPKSLVNTERLDAPFVNVEVPDANFDCDLTLENNTNDAYSKHVLRVSRDGFVMQAGEIVEGTEKPEDVDEAYAQMINILCAAEKTAKEYGGKKKIELLVHVHGGLNTYKDTNERINEELHLKILGSGEDAKYPVFLSWPSGPLSTWLESTFRIREGKKTSKPLGASTAPFIVASEIFSSAGNLPRTALYQLTNEKDRVVSAGLPRSWLSKSWKDTVKRSCGDRGLNECAMTVPDIEKINKIESNISIYKTKKIDRFANGTYQTVTLPFRYTLGSLWHSSISESAWMNMKRRTKNMFYPPNDFDTSEHPGVRGGDFFELLLKRIKYNQLNDGVKYEITLVGHSMGTIVLNHALEKYQSNWIASESLSNVVYMGAACSISDAIRALAPIVAPTSLNGVANSQESGAATNFYNLTLNRVAEVAEMHGYGFIPLGSLLVSIDQHYEAISHPLERTLGSEVNVHSSLFVLEKSFQNAQGNIVFKSFNRDIDSLPSEHGDFNKIPFWKKSTWELNRNQGKSPGESFICSVLD